MKLGATRAELASLPQVKLALMSALGPTGERQEHLDAITACASWNRGGACFEPNSLAY